MNFYHCFSGVSQVCSIIFQQHLCKLGKLQGSNGRNSQVFGQAMKKRRRNFWPPHFRTFCELVEGEENKLTTFPTWTIMSSSISANLGNSREAMEIHKYSVKQ